MEEKKIIEFRNIVKSFDGQVILKGINLDIYENEFVTLLGPAAAAKPRCCVFWAVSFRQMKVMLFLTVKKSIRNRLMSGN